MVARDVRDVNVWHEALKKALEMTVEPNASWCTDPSEDFSTIIDDTRSLTEVLYCKPDMPGVNACADNLAAVLGIDTFQGHIAVTPVQRLSHQCHKTDAPQTGIPNQG